jgi:hypothetical protein
MNKKYLTKLFLTSTLVALAIFFWNFFVTKLSNPHIWFILPYFMLATPLIHNYFLNNADPKKFVMRFMAVTGIKLLLNLVMILAYGLILKNGAITFALSFLVIYFTFTSFEIAQLLKHFNTKELESK